METDPNTLNQFGFYTTKLSSDFEIIQEFTVREGANKSGFTGLLSPLTAAMDALTALSAQANSGFQSRMDQLGQGVCATAADYGSVEESNAAELDAVEPQSGGYDQCFVDGSTGRTAAGNTAGDWQDLEPIQAGAPEVGSEKISDVIDKDFGAGDVVNWVWKEIVGPLVGTGDKDLYDLLVEPLTGDFNRIRANAAAWTAISGMYFAIDHNLAGNTHVLVSEVWTGDAASQFELLVTGAWTPSFYVAKEVSVWLCEGFEKLADISISLAKKCAELIDAALKLMAKLAKKTIPGYGQVWALFDWVASGFEDTPYISEAMEIADVISQVMALFENLKAVVTSLEEYVNYIQVILDAVTKLPEVNTLHDALALADTVEAATNDLAEQQQSADATSETAGEDLAELDQYAASD